MAENSDKGRRNLKIPVMAFIFVFMVVGIIEAQTDNRLNGTWFTVEEEIELEYKFTSGNYETFISGLIMEKGTYTSNNNVLNMITTHIHGSFLTVLFGGEFTFESRWYTTDEFMRIVKPIFLEIGFTEKQINEMFSEMISSSTSFSYSINANSLILTDLDDETVYMFTKR
jgi:hypothetical protein